MRTLVVGFDSLDPRVFERLYEQGRMPNLGRLVETNGYSRFQVANPPQSEVSWTSIATGLNPGDHGMFDFVHRDAKTYTPFVSLLPTEQRLGMTSFVRPCIGPPPARTGRSRRAEHAGPGLNPP